MQAKMHGLIGLWSLAVASSALAADGNPDREALRAFGLFAHWAIDCGNPASNTNPHSRFVFAEDWPPIYQAARLDAAWNVRDVRIIDPDRLSLSLSTGVATFVTITLVKADRRIRTVESIAGDGHSAIHEGIQVGSGREVPWLERCEPAS
jgi:hypothetical protein